MAVFLDRIDSVPLEDDEFSFSYNSWVAILVDTLNESLETIQNNFNGFNTGLVAGQMTQVQILALPATTPNGTIIYCSDHVPPCMVVKLNGNFVQLNTSAFP